MKNSRILNAFFVVVLFIGLCCLVSCAAKPHKTTGYLGDYSHMYQTPNFNRFYAVPGVDFREYENVIVKPINTFFLADSKWYDVKYKEDELIDLVMFMKQTFSGEMSKSFNVVNNSDTYKEKTLVLETALVNLIPVDVISNVTTAALVGLPFSKGVIAVEARLVDANSRMTLMKFTDTRRGKENIVNVKDYTKFSHARDTIEEWAVELHKILIMGEAKREGYFGGTFELKAW